ncbi:RagB/SusD family nutrient uptake outer membrane protein [Flavobacterium granuli]|uniref:SusD family protein n=1 Tax=Flavobacterium granuli TaxID=280093 RepID=A0A1M5U5X8_9FLAO|nr:RagB/SusD family nutrient uptake outer membrane protein [Flavobacterium granuli]PRZ19566.1 SusD-like starch-binding protein associating with outer membrane [Flavobacterium granuli]SHH58407.1 SusD family protein [Flavobacterium granuli]
MKNYIKPIILFIAFFPFVGCDDFVDVAVPYSQLTGNLVFEDANTANAAIADIYSKLRDTGMLTGSSLGSAACLGLYADELVYYGANNENSLFIYNNTLLGNTAAVSQLWNQSYHQIYCANAIIEGCERSQTLSTANKNQFIGEAVFIRALIHFYLTNLYGDVPYIDATNYETNRLLPRMPVATVSASIIADLNRAIALLPENYLSADRVRPNRSTAIALLARVYLYKGDWAEAANAASAVLNNPIYVWENNIDKTFLKECKATIWQFIPKVAGNNTDEGALFILKSGPPTFAGLRPELFQSFGSNDLRKTRWIASVTDGKTTWYHANKYKQKSNTGTSVEYSIIFRLAEQYLIRAEARARQGELIGAKEDLNVVRKTAGLSNTTAVTADAIVAAVIQERRFELFTESGHRFFDLKRNGALDSVLPTVKPGWNSTDVLWPIPEKELLANPNLVQNLGY